MFAQIDAGIPHGRHNSCPVRIRARNSGLHQRSFRDDFRDPVGLVTRPQAADVDGDEVPCSLGVANDLHRKIPADFVNRFFQRQEIHLL